MLTDERRKQMVTLRLEGKTLPEIGRQFGISGERVRQLIGGLKRPKPVKPIPRGRLHRIMVRWLHNAGIRKCYVCKLWSSDVKDRRCQECNRERMRRYLSTERGKEKSREWQRAHADHLREYGRRYYQARKAATAQTGESQKQ